MRPLAHAEAYQVLLLQASDGGRGPVLFGESLPRAREVLLPFMVGRKFPSVYLEHPLKGDPFLDVTVLYSNLAPGTRVDSPMVGSSQAMLDWFAGLEGVPAGVCCGFEVDAKDPALPPAAVHFQPHQHTELVPGFFEAVGESARAQLYLDQAEHMPPGWPLSFFGLFRGRPGSPLRVCGYFHPDEIKVCAHDPRHLARRFDAMGFSAYDEAMLKEVCGLLTVAPPKADFQLDIYPDGSVGSTFAIDLQFGIKQPEQVRASFADGPGARVMGLLERWGIADDRWQLGAQAAFARALPVELDDGTQGRYALTLMPQWVKVRWMNGALQPSKLYLLAHGTLL